MKNSSKNMATVSAAPLVARPLPLEVSARAHPLLSLSLLVLAVFLGRFNQSALYPLQESMAKGLGLSDNYVALMQGPALILPFIILAVPLGMAVDRIVRVRLLIGAMLSGAIGSLLTAWAINLPVMFAGRALVGLGTAATTVTAFSMIADLFPASQRGRAKSAAEGAGHIGSSVAFFAGGLLLAAGTGAKSDWSWATAWMVTPLVVGAVLLLALQEPPRAERHSSWPTLRQMRAGLKGYKATIMPLATAAILIEIPTVATLTWASPILMRTFELGPDGVGAIMGVVMLLSGILGPVACGFVSDICQRRGGPHRAAAAIAILVLITAPGCLFVIIPDPFVASVVLGFYMTCLSGALSMTTTTFMVVIPAELRGLCISLLSAAAALSALALAPVMISMLSSVIGGPGMLGVALALISIPCSVLASLILFWGLRYLPRQDMSDEI